MVVNKVTMPAQPNINIRRAFLNRKVPGDFDNLNGNDCPTIMNNFKNVPRTGNTQLQTNSQTSTSTRVTTSCSTQSTRRTTSSDHKATIMKTDLSEFRNNMKNMKNSGLSLVTEQIRNSLENLIDEKEDEEMNEPVIEFPDDTPVPSEVGSPTTTMETMKFEHKTANSNFKKTQVINGVKTEKESTNSAEVKKLQAGELSYEENMAAQKRRALLEVDGVSAEKSQLSASEAISLKLGDLSQRECNNMAQTNMKVSSGQFSKEQTALQTQGEKQTVTNSKFYNQQHSSTLSTYSTTSRGITTSASVQSCTQKQIELNLEEDKIIHMPLDDLESLSKDSSQQDIDTAKKKYSVLYERLVDSIQKNEIKSKPEVLDKMYDVMQKAWAVPTHGLELGYTLCNTLRTCGGLDMLMANCTIPDAKDLKFSSARLLEQSLITENREYVVANGLEKVVNVACICTKKTDSVEHSRVGTGILEHLFKDSVETCSDVVRLGGLDALLFECRKSDIETLRHCAGALANLSLYGGTENQEAMIKRKVPMWLFPLALHTDDNIKYYACLAITVLVANAEIEADVLQSGTLDLVEPFVTSHNPSEFAKSNLAHAHGQSKSWLKQLVPVLKSKREEARNLAAFHFCMEAGIKKQQGNTNIFSEINAIESLQTVASCPNAIASKYAAQALRLIGEKVPHKLSQQVPLWSVTDVREWVKQIGFEEHADRFYSSCVDGDLLLQLNDENLARDIEMQNGIKRKRFTRELQKLKKMADYSSKDTSNINNFLQNLGPEFSIYTYSFLNAGVEDKETLRNLSEDQLAGECGIRNSIHRFRILEGIKQIENCLGPQVGDQLNKSLDVFVSYRRSNGSQLASLLKVHLQLRGFSVFIDVERLEAGKFDNNLLQSIQKAKHFLLVLTPSSLDRCMKDDDGKDWVHREIVAALNSKCNIVPIIDNFQWPEADELPEDMRQICHFNGVRWIHDYQDACVEKIERFLRGEPNAAGMPCLKGDLTPGTQTRVPPTYQRLLSNDSGSGKEKDVNGNSGHNRSD